MVKRRSEVFRAAAVTKVHSHYVETGLKSLSSGSEHVNRIAGTLDAVPKHHSRMFDPISVPTTMCQDPGVRGDFKQAFLVAGGPKSKASWPGKTCQRLGMTAAEKRMRLKRLTCENLSNLCEKDLDRRVDRLRTRH